MSDNIFNNYATTITTTNLQNQINNFSPINLQYGINIIPSNETYNAQGGKGTVTRSNYIRFNYGRQWCISNQDNASVLNSDNLYFHNYIFFQINIIYHYNMLYYSNHLIMIDVYHLQYLN